MKLFLLIIRYNDGEYCVRSFSTRYEMQLEYLQEKQNHSNRYYCDYTVSCKVVKTGTFRKA